MKSVVTTGSIMILVLGLVLLVGSKVYEGSGLIIFALCMFFAGMFGMFTDDTSENIMR